MSLNSSLIMFSVANFISLLLLFPKASAFQKPQFRKKLIVQRKKQRFQNGNAVEKINRLSL